MGRWLCWFGWMDGWKGRSGILMNIMYIDGPLTFEEKYMET